jgi:hypothetical protein
MPQSDRPSRCPRSASQAGSGREAAWGYSSWNQYGTLPLSIPVRVKTAGFQSDPLPELGTRSHGTSRIRGRRAPGGVEILPHSLRVRECSRPRQRP